MTTFTVDGPFGPVAGIDTGNGPAVALLAGLGATHRVWGELPALLSRRFRVVAPDPPGLGGSRGGAAFTIERAASDLWTALDARGVQRAALLGASMGGLIALAAALARPDRVSRLVIVSAAAHLSRHGRRVLQTLAELLGGLPPETFGSALMAFGFAPPFTERHGDFIDATVALYGPAPEDIAGALAQVNHLLLGWDLRPRLADLSVPALVLAGGRDPIVALEDTREIAKMLPHGRFVTIPDAGHSVLAEGGQEVLGWVTAFLTDEGVGDRQ